MYWIMVGKYNFIAHEIARFYFRVVKYVVNSERWERSYCGMSEPQTAFQMSIFQLRANGSVCVRNGSVVKVAANHYGVR